MGTIRLSRLNGFHRRLLFSTERLLQTWREVGVPPRPRSPASECHFCQQPLHFDLMSERERSFFTGLSRLIPAVA